jgi:hypothetical protein
VRGDVNIDSINTIFYEYQAGDGRVFISLVERIGDSRVMLLRDSYWRLDDWANFRPPTFIA